MRFRYSAQACSAQAGNLALTATTWSLGTRPRFPGGFCALEPDRLAAPDLLEVVEVARRGMHDMHDDVAQVDEHPFAARRALDAVDARAELAHPFLDAVGQRLDLTVRIAACDHHTLEHRGQARGVEDDDVVALHVLERLDHHALLPAD